MERIDDGEWGDSPESIADVSETPGHARECTSYNNEACIIIVNVSIDHQSIDRPVG